jgi:hypothetical protein
MKDRQAIPRPNLGETRAFLANLPVADTEHLASIGEGRGPIVRTFGKSDLSAAIAWLTPLQGRVNCYFHPNQLHPSITNRKAKREDVLQARMAHVDIDDLAALERIEAFPLPPTAVIMSGGGYQCLWFFDVAVPDLDRVETINRRLAEALGGDSCHSADHLMRLPGTLNVPNANKRAKGRTVALAAIVPELTDYSRSCALEELEAAFATVALPEARPSPRNSSGPVVLFTADTVTVAVSDYTRSLIRNGDNLERPIGSETGTYRSRSEAVFRVACDLAIAGADEAAIVGVLINPANGISASVLEKARSTAYAERQARQALRAIGEGWPSVGRGGHPLPTFANALTALARLGLRFEYDAFQNRRRVDGYPLQDMAGELTDDLCAAIRHEVLRRWQFDPGKEHVRDAAQTLCLENTVHPVRDYLEGLKWDGRQRAGSWLVDYLGADDTPLHRAMGELVLMAAVRRVRQPGAKFDSILVLEGRQGSGKSTAINILASEAYFSDQDCVPACNRDPVSGVIGA